MLNRSARCLTCESWGRKHCGDHTDNPIVPPAPTCAGCGIDLTDDNTACQPCDRCHDCAPGDCHECRQLRAKDTADLYRRHQQETP